MHNVGTPNIGEEAATSSYTDTLATYNDVPTSLTDIFEVGSPSPEEYDCIVFATATFDVIGNDGGIFALNGHIDAGGPSEQDLLDAPVSAVAERARDADSVRSPGRERLDGTHQGGLEQLIAGRDGCRQHSN